MWTIDGSPVFSESITVGPAETTFVQVVNQTDAAVCAIHIVVAGASSPGLNMLSDELAPGSSVRFDVPAAAHDVVVEACSGARLWAANGLSVPPVGASIALTA